MAGGQNTYSYVKNSPISFSDISGTGPVGATAVAGFCTGYTIGDTYNLMKDLEQLLDKANSIRDQIYQMENACPLENRRDWYQDYINKLREAYRKTIEAYLRKKGDMLSSQIAQEVLRLVELRVIMPYEGTMINGSEDVKKFHCKMMGNIRTWFNKLQNEYTK